MQPIKSDSCSFYFIRFKPGQDVRHSLLTFCQENSITAGSIISAVGSLKKVKIRKARSDSFYESSDPHEILTLSGLVSAEGNHIHISLADQNAIVSGGHLSEGNLVYTTLEIVIAVFPNIRFDREVDPETQFKELVIRTGAIVCN
ncbi:MAG: DNA-binding protein [Bdellovibrionaceae bacterium]|nr:DNA-binding protein [Pseudobdellovibrionaceae bacterium]